MMSSQIIFFFGHGVSLADFSDKIWRGQKAKHSSDSSRLNKNTVQHLAVIIPKEQRRMDRMETCPHFTVGNCKYDVHDCNRHTQKETRSLHSWIATFPRHVRATFCDVRTDPSSIHVCNVYESPPHIFVDTTLVQVQFGRPASAGW